MITLGRNIAALGASRSLDRATDIVARTAERLSSGQRINRASDDAAGIAVADALKSRSKLFDVAGRNINDGISALNIASSAIDSQVTILQRLAELAEQSANGTYGTTQRASADREYQALIKEYGRIGDATTFNGISLLRAGRGTTPASLQIQTGITGQASSTLAVEGANSATLSGTIYAGEILGSSVAFSANGQLSFEALVTRSQGQYFSTSLTDQSGRNREIFLQVGYQETAGYQILAYARNSDIGPDGYEYDEGFPINGQSNLFFFGVYNASGSSVTVSTTFDQGTITGSLTLDLSGLTFARSGSAPPTGTIAGDVSRSTAIEFSNVATVTGAKSALTMVNARLSELSAIQGRFGAAQSRLESSFRGAESSRINNLAAESRIRDVDIAEETARRTLAQIRQETSAQVLRQAVRQPEIALILLRS